MAGDHDGGRLELWGLVLTAIGVQFSVFANSLMKTVTTVPVLQAMQVRFVIQVGITASIGVVLRCRGRPIHLLGKPGDRLLLLARAVFFAVAILSLWTALRVLPIGESTTIVYLYPVFCGLLANRFLNEPLGMSFWIQAFVCCVGVLLVTGFGFYCSGGEGPKHDRGVCLALLAAFCFASTNCCVRALRDAQTLEVQLFTDSVMATAVMPVTLLVTGNGGDWSGWTSHVFLQLTGATMFGLCALLIVVLGHQLAPASKATLFTYLEVPSAFVVQALLFGEVPPIRKAIGAGLIMVAALHRFGSEVSKHKEASETPLLRAEADLSLKSEQGA